MREIWPMRKMRNRQSSKMWSFFSGCNDYKGRTNTLEPSTTQLKQWVQTYLFEMKYVPNTSSNANRKIQSHRFKWQRNIAIIWISIVESPLDQYWFTSSILQIFKGLFNYFNQITHSPSKLRPSQIKQIDSKPSSIFLRTMCIGSGLLNFFNWKVQNLDQNVTISKATHAFQEKLNFPG